MQIKLTPDTAPELYEWIEKIIEDKLAARPKGLMVSRKDAASYLGVHIKTIDKWIMEGKIKKYKVGNRTYVKRIELENLFKPVNDVR